MALRVGLGPEEVAHGWLKDISHLGSAYQLEESSIYIRKKRTSHYNGWRINLSVQTKYYSRELFSRNELSSGKFGSDHTLDSDCSSLVSGRRPSVDTISTYLSQDDDPNHGAHCSGIMEAG